MKSVNKLALCVALLSTMPAFAAMQALNEAELGEVTGEGLGTTIENLAIYSADYGQPKDFSIRLNLDESANPDALILSELRIHKSGTEAGSADSGGFIGTYNNPMIQNEMRDIKNTAGYTFTGLYTAWPNADLQQMDRSFYTWSKSHGASGYRNIGDKSGNGSSYYRGLPNGFFTTNGKIDVGNFYTLADQYKAEQDAFAAKLNSGMDKFDVHLRVDVNINQKEQFLSYLDILGLQIYANTQNIWGHYDVRGTEHYGRGLAMATTAGLKADSLVLTTNADKAAASRVEMRGVDVYIPQGSADQPLTISTVKYKQIKRGTWKNPEYDTEARTQLRMEVAALPAAAKQAAQGHIYVESMYFGDPSKYSENSEVWTGKDTIYLRDANGNVKATIPNVDHYAFVPKTVIYNEQITKYNEQNPNAKLPYIPNQNVIEIKGLEIQRMVMTTQDLNR